MEGQFVAVFSLAFVLGLKHATDADHVAAVTTLVSRERSLLRSCWIGVFWGAGHTLSLAIAGILVLILKVNISSWVESRLELAVAVMLMMLGSRVLYQAWRGRFAIHRHAHIHSGATAPHNHWHVHARTEAPSHTGWVHVGLRPLVVGMVHGAAGSGALMLLVLSTIRSSLEGLFYITIFGVGSVAGMLLISLLLALPMQWVGHRVAGGHRPAQIAAGLFSCISGIYLAWSITYGA